MERPGAGGLFIARYPRAPQTPNITYLPEQAEQAEGREMSAISSKSDGHVQRPFCLASLVSYE